MGLFKNDATRIGFIIIAIIFIFGTFCIYDVNRKLSLTSKVIGYFQHTENVSKINDFEYDVTSLLFTNSGANENEYFAEIVTDPIEGFDRTKKYNLEINGNKCGYVASNLEFVNADFINTFYATNNTVLLTDSLNIKVNFYKDGTKIVLITNNGEKAVKLWQSYIQKNGFKIKIVEDEFNSVIEADNIPSYTVNLYFEDELFQTLNYTSLTFDEISLPTIVNNKQIIGWKDINGNYITKENLPRENINLYAELPVDYTVNLYVNDEIYKTIIVNMFTQNDFTLPLTFNNFTIASWQDKDGNVYKSIPLANIDIYAIFEGLNTTSFILEKNNDANFKKINSTEMVFADYNWPMNFSYQITSSNQSSSEQQQSILDKINAGGNLEISNVNFTINDLSFRFDNIETYNELISIHRTDRRLSTKNLFICCLDENAKTIKIINFVFALQPDTEGFHFYLSTSCFSRTFSNNDYENFKTNKYIKNAKIIDEQHFNSLSNAISEDYLKINHDISFVMDIKND